jgi:hypothetical protein
VSWPKLQSILKHLAGVSTRWYIFRGKDNIKMVRGKDNIKKIGGCFLRQGYCTTGVDKKFLVLQEIRILLKLLKCATLALNDL